MGKTSIQWTEHSINPIRARNRETGAVGHFCEKVSPGCAKCYASSWNERVRPSGKHLIGTGLPFLPVNQPKVEIFLDKSKLLEVLGRKVPTAYFWCDMTDLFGAWVPDWMIDACFATMALTPQHTHMVLTKRSERMRDYMVSRSKSASFWKNAAREIGYSLDFNGYSLVGSPLPNVRVGVSVENRRQRDRILHLNDTPAASRFLSLEPLLEDLELNAAWIFYIDWLIAGGESGRRPRACNVAWIRAIVRLGHGTGTPVFVKQLGAHCIMSGFEYAASIGAAVECKHGFDVCPQCDAEPRRRKFRNAKGGDPAEWPEDLRVREFPGQAVPA